MADNNNRDFSDSELDRLLEEYSQYKSVKAADEKPADDGNKKFVVHIDESLIDELDFETEKNKQQKHPSGGVYFSSYQQKNKRQTKTAAPVSPRPVVKQVSKTTAMAKKKIKKSFGGGIAAGYLAFIIAATIILSYIGLTCVGDMLAINRSENPVNVDIPDGASYSDVIDVLSKNGLIKRKAFCKVFTNYRGFDDETYLSGNYTLTKDMGVEGMLMHVMEAPVSAEASEVSIPEGMTISQIFERLQKNDVCDATKLYAAARTPSTYSSFDFLTDITPSEDRYLVLEGYLFPDTYQFYVDADPNYVFRKFLENFENKWEDEYDARAEKFGLSRDEIITIASIIQKEAADEEQMKIISSVIHNRLSDRANYPTLGCDCTSIYITNYVTPVVGEVQGAKYLDAYNTSAIQGLPPGPICNPGMAAIKAALYPEDTGYYFFAHDKSGKIYLAETFSEHKNNLVKIIKANNGN